MLSCVVELVVPTILKDCVACVSVKWSEKMSLVGMLLDLTFPQNIRKLSPSVTLQMTRIFNPIDSLFSSRAQIHFKLFQLIHLIFRVSFCICN